MVKDQRWADIVKILGRGRNQRKEGVWKKIRIELGRKAPNFTVSRRSHKGPRPGAATPTT